MSYASHGAYGPNNEVTGPYTAIVDGKPTSLAGCSDSHRCPAKCLRADPMLQKSDLGCRNARFYIPIVEVRS